MPGMMKRPMMKKGGKAKMKKGGKAKKFPDLSGDGKVTKKDVLIARGVIKNGKAMSKRKSSSKKKV